MANKVKNTEKISTKVQQQENFFLEEMMKMFGPTYRQRFKVLFLGVLAISTDDRAYPDTIIKKATSFYLSIEKEEATPEIYQKVEEFITELENEVKEDAEVVSLAR